MLDLRDLEGVERLCQADMTWKLVPLYYCPGKEREACIVSCLLSTGGIDVILKSMDSLESTRLCSRDRQSRRRNMSDTLEVLWYLPFTHLAALL